MTTIICLGNAKRICAHSNAESRLYCLNPIVLCYVLASCGFIIEQNQLGNCVWHTIMSFDCCAMNLEIVVRVISLNLKAYPPVITENYE